MVCIWAWVSLAEPTWAHDPINNWAGFSLFSATSVLSYHPCTGHEIMDVSTWIIAIRRTFPCRPMAMDPIAIAAGPAMNLKTIPNTVRLIPHAISFSCIAMNSPTKITKHYSYLSLDKILMINLVQGENMISPILNMAIPVPALDMTSTDPSIMLGIAKCHL